MIRNVSRLGQSNTNTSGPAAAAAMAATALAPNLRVCDAQGNCTMVPGANYPAAAQALNSGMPIASVAAMYGGSAVLPFYQSAAALTPPAAIAPAPPAQTFSTVVNLPPVSLPPPATAPAAPANYSSAEIVGNQTYTADLETVQQVMYQYGDTWDNSQTVVDNFYAQGVEPGTITPAMALSALTNVSAAAGATGAAASSFILASPSTWPWYLWAGVAAVGLFAFSSSKKH
jgi:hypothetical protein